MNVNPMYPVWPQVRCVQCARVYTMPEHLREQNPLRGHCWNCGTESFNTTFVVWSGRPDPDLAGDYAAEEQPRCTGCIFDGDVLSIEDLACPVHGIDAQTAAEAAGWDRVEWMRACRASWPFAPRPDPDLGGDYAAEWKDGEPPQETP